MKKPMIFFIPLAIFVILASCSSSEIGDSFYGIDSKTFFEKVSLPEKLSINIKLDEIKNIDEAKTYKADYIEFDKRKLIDAFIKNTVTEEKIWAEGPQIIASSGNVKEFLNIHDGGKSYGAETGMEGGFYYFKGFDDILWQKLDAVAAISFNDLGYNEQYKLNSDYSSYSDLNFLSYEDSLTDIQGILKIAGMPQFDIGETYSLDLETMKAHYELYFNGENVDEERKNISWTNEDECYIFSLRQLVDNIPIVNKSWQMPDGTKASVWGNPMSATSIHLVYDKAGISEITAENVLNVTGEIESDSIVNLYEALNTLIKNYSLTILEDDISIVSAELCYLNIPKDGIIELVPGWVFRSAKDKEVDGRTYIQYKYDVVNAVTGKLYQDRW